LKGKISEVVFDIETLPSPQGASEETEYAARGVREGEDPPDLLRRMSFAPLTARTLSVAMLNPDTGRGVVWYEHPGGAVSHSANGLITLVPAAEEKMLEGFWETVTRFQRLITFNGRSFDSPFLMLRSALLGIPPARNLLPYRFSAFEHCDLLDQLTFYGATRKFSLDAYCRGFSIAPPGGGEGRPDVSQLVSGGLYREVAELAARTVSATGELYRRWQGYLSFSAGSGLR